MRLELDLPRAPSAAAVARSRFDDHLRDELEPEGLNELKLVASELINNAYLHGHGGIRLTIERTHDALMLEVVDEGEPDGVGIRPDPGATGGWGLRIVDRVSRQWGVYEGTTHVWAELPLRPAQRSGEPEREPAI